tara:strand:+ start:4828 stop:5769 length:942 start_codon:yes stop_codon:yes gene_type:complete
MLFNKVFATMCFMTTLAFNPAIKSMSNIVQKRLGGEEVKCYEMEGIDKKETPCVLFFTGLNAMIPGDVYSNFLEELAGQGMSTYMATTDKDNTNDLVEDLLSNYANLTVLGHSSGCVNALQICNDNKEIKTAVLMDPVDNSMFFKDLRGKQLILKNVERLMFLNAAKSYKWDVSLTNFNVPFIPGFRIDDSNLKLKKGLSNMVEAVDFGHSDVLDEPWSDVMHNSISKGSVDRETETLSEYRYWLGLRINNFIKDIEPAEKVKLPNETLIEATTDVKNFVTDVKNQLTVKASELIESRMERKNEDGNVRFKKN